MSVTRIPILMYHRLGAAKNDWERKYCVSERLFTAHMDALARAGWHALALPEFVNWLDGELELHKLAFLLTFDDGFQSVHDLAAPVLARKGWPATVFLVSALLGQTDAWCARQNPAGRTYPLMGPEHIREMRKHGFTFQSHTRTHADLPSLDDDALRQELAGSRAELQSVLGESVDCMAYPYGRLDDRVVRATRAAGYRAAFSTQPGFNRRDIDRFRLRRLDVFGNDSAAALTRKITLGTNDGSIAHALKYRLTRAAAWLRRDTQGLQGGGAK